MTVDMLLGVAAVCLLISLLLAWIASLIVYTKVQFLKRLFPATHQLIRAHIDYLLMTGLLVVSHYLCITLDILLPAWVIVVVSIGALYNPFGFILLAIKPQLANPKTRSEQLKILLGFIPATLGYGYVMVAVLLTLF